MYATDLIVLGALLNAVVVTAWGLLRARAWVRDRREVDRWSPEE